MFRAKWSWISSLMDNTLNKRPLSKNPITYHVLASRCRIFAHQPFISISFPNLLRIVWWCLLLLGKILALQRFQVLFHQTQPLLKIWRILLNTIFLLVSREARFCLCMTLTWFKPSKPKFYFSVAIHVKFYRPTFRSPPWTPEGFRWCRFPAIQLL